MSAVPPRERNSLNCSTAAQTSTVALSPELCQCEWGRPGLLKSEALISSYYEMPLRGTEAG